MHHCVCVCVGNRIIMTSFRCTVYGANRVRLTDNMLRYWLFSTDLLYRPARMSISQFFDRLYEHRLCIDNL